MKTRLFVKLLIPDTTAITAKRTLEQIGFRIPALTRYDYYEIDADDDVYEVASSCDLLVNTNKHSCSKRLENSPGTQVLVLESADDNLKRSLSHYGLPVKAVRKGVVWDLATDEETAQNATKELLYNQHYQEYEIL